MRIPVWAWLIKSDSLRWLGVIHPTWETWGEWSVGNITELIKQKLRELPYSLPECGGQDEKHFTTDPAPPSTVIAEHTRHCEPPGMEMGEGLFSRGLHPPPSLSSPFPCLTGAL